MTKPATIQELKNRAEALLKFLSHPNRLLIACMLTEGELSVSELEAETDISQPHLSRDLGRLREAGLVSARRESKNVYYEIAEEQLVHLIDALCRACGSKPKRKKRRR